MRIQLKIKDLIKGQIIYDNDPDDRYRVYSNPYIVDGIWHVEVTTSGDYSWTFKDGDEIFGEPMRCP